jgi:hypothetical protein
MAKRGETLPWKVSYQYEGQPRYTIAKRSQGEAEAAALEIQTWAERRDMRVTVEIKQKG